MKKIIFHKLHGAGNDFIIFNPEFSVRNKKSFVKKLCQRSLGVGADGVVFLYKKRGGQNLYRWDFFNKDGSSAEACMNASRCVVYFVSQVLKKSGVVRFETAAGLMAGEVQKKGVELELLNISEEILREKKEVPLKNKKRVSGVFLDTGVPHFVVTVSEWAPEKWREMAAEIQKYKKFFPKETNVTFVQKKKSPHLRAVSFERGVRDYTLACGTGAVAAALATSKFKGTNRVAIQMPGGELEVYKKGFKYFLKGPVALVYRGEIDERSTCFME